MRVGRVASPKTQVPYDFYELGLCPRAAGVRDKPANLGEILESERFHDAPFRLEAVVNSTCRPLCGPDAAPLQLARVVTYPAPAELAHDPKASAAGAPLHDKLKALIADGYYINLRTDNMPGMYVPEGIPDASLLAQGKLSPKQRGFPLGWAVAKDADLDAAAPLTPGPDDVYFLKNHVTLWVEYHALDPTPGDPGPLQHVRIISLYLTAESIDGGIPECTAAAAAEGGRPVPSQRLDAEEAWLLYSVKWVPTDRRWANRWDSILALTQEDDRMNWAGIINSFSITCALGFIVGVILLKAVRNDIYVLDAQLDEELQDATNVPWKLLAGDVFRPPARARALAILYGSGVQILAISAVQIGVAVAGFYSPSNRGAFLSSSLILYGLFGSVASYHAVLFYRSVVGHQRLKSLIVATGLLVPGILFAVFLVDNFALWGAGSVSDRDSRPSSLADDGSPSPEMARPLARLEAAGGSCAAPH